MARGPSYAGFVRFCGRLGYGLEPFQRRIARAAFGPEPELVALLPRGNWKTTTLALLNVYPLLSVERPAAYCAASSREQARILWESAADFARHPSLDGQITIRHLELRV